MYKLLYGQKPMPGEDMELLPVRLLSMVPNNAPLFLVNAHGGLIAKGIKADYKRLSEKQATLNTKLVLG